MKNIFTLFVLCISIQLSYAQIACNSLLNVSLDINGSVQMTPDMMIVGALDPTSTYTINPTTFDCSAIDTAQIATVTEISAAGDTSTCWGQVIVSDLFAPVPVVNSEVVIVVSADPSVFTTISPDDVNNGSWDNCGNITFSLSQTDFNVDDIGQTTIIVMTVVDGSGNVNTAWSTAIVTLGDDGGVFCDTECHSTPLGDCASGHTDEDYIELPCDLVLDPAGEVFTLESLSPDNLVAIYGVDPADAAVEIVETVEFVIQETYEDLVIIEDSVVKILRTWTLIEWITTETHTYTQLITVNGTLESTGLFICDTLPNSAPITDCDGGHTLDDQVEWPDDVSITDLRITPDELFSISEITYEDTRPVLNADAPAGTEVEYADMIAEIGNFELDIDRLWTISHNDDSYEYTQRIHIDATEDTDSLVTVTTHQGRAIPNVDVNGMVMTNEQGIAFLSPDVEANLEFTDDPLDQVDVLDLILIRNHILARIELAPFQILASDINGNGAVSSLDMVLLMRMILGIDDASETLLWNFEETNNLLTERNFIGYKIGDVNDDAVLSGAVEDNIDMLIQDVLINAGESYTARLGLGADVAVAGFDLNMQFNTTDMEIQEVYLNGDDNRTPITWTAENGNLRILSIVQGTATIAESTTEALNDAVIEIEFTANVNGLLSRMITFDETQLSYLIDESDTVYNVTGNISGEILTSTHDLDVDYGLTLYPNPASDILYIDTQDAEAIREAQVVILDPLGRVVYTNEKMTSSIQLDRFSDGLHTLSVITKQGVDSKRFMIVR